ncbi:M56 family metallopeptidase [Psychroflexus sediminis]|uniref:Signal transducer regulating beta-lactamase production, contains metallopeptidase domain n=1 Tax=Psychroflexus sediminis TaxID=470826 RepID=A0A1G7W136_9FLAO|nr:M56 family metallopeptidase [Psychroflexus sediminis]SDG64840.1 Signal transducer regulating beta-lactamase production, contains metallopeptidase domain [Psychroflexus sediminis]
MEHFLINSSVCLFVLWLFYKLALENSSWHHWKRFYLIGALLISSIIPFIVIETIVIPIQETSIAEIADLSTGKAAIEAQNFEINGLYILMAVYLIGVAVMLWRFGKNFYSFTIKPDDEVSQYKIYPLILRQEITVPHSFFNRIFVNAKTYKKDLIPEVVLEHEKAHLDQKHSIDIVFIELLLVFFWFNPIFYIIRYSMKLNHEFLADRSVIQQGVNTMTYQELILQHATNSYQHSMANTFHFPIIKKRFNIMKTNTSKANGLLRSLAVIPILTFLIISCGKEEIQLEEISNKNLPQKIVSFVNNKIDDNKTFLINGTEYSAPKVIEELKDYPNAGMDLGFKYNEKSIISIDTNRFESEENLQNALNMLIEETSGKSFAEEQIPEYNRLAKKHKAYMDKNNTLIAWKDDTSRMQDLYHSMTQEQRDNNESWPYLGRVSDLKPGQVPPPPPPAPAQKQQNPPTQKEVGAYNAWAKKIHSETTQLSGNAKLLPIVDEHSLSKFLEIYKRMSQTQKNQSIEFPFPGLKDSQHSFMSDTLTEKQAATKNQIADYNAWARIINSAMEKAEATNNKSLYPIVKQKDHDKYYNIYRNIMTETQRKNSEPWPSFPPPPAPHNSPSPE